MASIDVTPDLLNSIFMLSHFINLSALGVIDLVSLHIGVFLVDPLTFTKRCAVEWAVLRVNVCSVIDLLIMIWNDLLFKQLICVSGRILFLILQHRSNHFRQKA